MDDECVILSSGIVIYAVKISFFPACKAGVSSPKARAVLGQDTPNASASLFFSSGERKKEGLFCALFEKISFAVKFKLLSEQNILIMC